MAPDTGRAYTVSCALQRPIYAVKTLTGELRVVGSKENTVPVAIGKPAPTPEGYPGDVFIWSSAIPHRAPAPAPEGVDIPVPGCVIC